MNETLTSDPADDALVFKPSGSPTLKVCELEARRLSQRPHPRRWLRTRVTASPYARRPLDIEEHVESFIVRDATD